MHAYVITLKRTGAENNFHDEFEVLDDLQIEGTGADYVDKVYQAGKLNVDKTEEHLKWIAEMLRGRVNMNGENRFRILPDAAKTVLLEQYHDFLEMVKGLTEEDFCTGRKNYPLAELLGAKDCLYIYDTNDYMQKWTDWLQNLYAESQPISYELVEVFDYHV